LIPRDYGVEPNDPEIIESRVTQITNDYPDLDYLLCFQSEKHSTWTSDEYKQWRHIFGRLYEEIGKRSPHTRLAVSGWGLNPKSIETLPEDVICAPIARYGASFENGQIYGNREYWGCPWLETDGNCSQHYYPYACHLSTTIASYQKRAPNMKGLYCLTWRISDAIEPKLSYIAKAPWDTENKYKSSHDVYHEYAQRCYGSNVAHAITEIINENEAFAEDHGECRQIPVFSGSDRKALQRPIIEIGTLCFYGENPQAAIEIPASKETKKYGATIGVKTSDKEGTYITSITTGNWIRYEIELASEVTTFEVRAKAARDCDIELRLNEFNGLLLGTCVAKASKDWQSFKTRISKISGKQTLYVRPLGQEMNDREKVKQQLATIDRQIDQAVGAGSRYRLQLLRERLAGVQAYLDIDKHFPTITWEELPGAFEPWVKSFMHRVYDISSLGNIMSTQHRFVKERYVVKETKLRAAQSVKAPSGVEARGTNVGAMIRWQNEQTQTQGYYVYRDGQRLNDQMLNAETTVFTDKANGTYRYQVTAVNNQGHESPRSIPSLCPAGSADEQAPRIIVISPPTSLTPGQALDVKATILDDRTYDSISAFLYYRKPGQKTWQQSLMERRTKAIFGKRVSGEAMTDAGLEYYVLASDGDNIDRYPATAPVLPLSVVAWHMEDTTAPDTPKQVAVSEQILKWSTSNDAFWYRLYRSRQPDFRPGPASFLTYAPLDITAFKDNGLDWNGQLLKGRWYYRITAQDQSDNESPASQAIAVEW